MKNEIHRNLLSINELEEIQQILTKSYWGFGYISNDIEKPIWNFDKEKGRKAAEIVASKFENNELIDWHINGQTFQLSGSLHDDSANGSKLAVVFFPHDWFFEWGGRLHIFNNSGVMSVTPEKNLCVSFDSKLKHYAEAPVVNKLRVSIGLKLK